MWIANQWKDYEVIDTSGGEKLERWGNYLLVRPDPQVLWNTPKEHSGWTKMNGHYHRSRRGAANGNFCQAAAAMVHQLPESWPYLPFKAV